MAEPSPPEPQRLFAIQVKRSPTQAQSPSAKGKVPRNPPPEPTTQDRELAQVLQVPRNPQLSHQRSPYTSQAGKVPRNQQSIRSEDKSENKGLASVDRSNKATLLLTAPRSIQVVCKGFTPAHIQFQYVDKPPKPFRLNGQIHLIWFTAEAYFDTTNTCGTNIIVSSTDSDLEAFSHNLAVDSFAPLPDRTGANTN